MHRRVSRIAVGIALALFVVELVLRIIFHSWGAFFYEPICVNRFQAPLFRIAYGFALFHEYIPEEQSSVYEPDPLRGYRLRPGLRGARHGDVLIHSNSVGARGSREIAERKPDGVLRLVALGDSFTFGDNAEEENTWPAQLATLLPGTEVVNLGASAYAHDQMLITLQEAVPALKPDIVVLGFMNTDITRNDTSRFCAEKPHFVQRDGQWRLENVPVPSPQEIERRYTRLPLVWTLTGALVETMKEYAGASEPSVDRDAQVTRYVFGEIRKSCNDLGIRFLTVFIPAPPELSDRRWPDRTVFRGICNSLELECLDTSPEFLIAFEELGRREYLESFFITGDQHYNGKGYRLVARAIADYLSRVHGN